MQGTEQLEENKTVSKKVIAAAVMGGALEWYDFGA